MTYDRMNRRHSLLAACGFALGGLSACSPGPVAVSTSPRDPSSPAAPEGTSPLLAAATDDHAAHEPGEVTYVCPMHPEVTSPAAGRCPKCGMHLVPKK
jgi:hypothetical protein